VWQAALIGAKPGPAISKDIAVDVQGTDPTARAYKAPQRGQGDVKFLPKGSEQNLVLAGAEGHENTLSGEADCLAQASMCHAGWGAGTAYTKCTGFACREWIQRVTPYVHCLQ